MVTQSFNLYNVMGFEIPFVAIHGSLRYSGRELISTFKLGVKLERNFSRRRFLQLLWAATAWAASAPIFLPSSWNLAEK